MEKETKKEEKKAPTANYPNRFFVHILHPDDNTYTTTLYTWSQILSFVDMSDCHDDEIRVFYSPEYGKVEELEVLGTWHDKDDPLLIELVNQKGEVIRSGYGTDH